MSAPVYRDGEQENSSFALKMMKKATKSGGKEARGDTRQIVKSVVWAVLHWSCR